VPQHQTASDRGLGVSLCTPELEVLSDFLSKPGSGELPSKDSREVLLIAAKAFGGKEDWPTVHRYVGDLPLRAVNNVVAAIKRLGQAFGRPSNEIEALLGMDPAEIAHLPTLSLEQRLAFDMSWAACDRSDPFLHKSYKKAYLAEYLDRTEKCRLANQRTKFADSVSKQAGFMNGYRQHVRRAQGQDMGYNFASAGALGVPVDRIMPTTTFARMTYILMQVNRPMLNELAGVVFDEGEIDTELFSQVTWYTEYYYCARHHHRTRLCETCVRKTANALNLSEGIESLREVVLGISQVTGEQLSILCKRNRSLEAVRKKAVR
jgi:hypothetical protein